MVIKRDIREGWGVIVLSTSPETQLTRDMDLIYFDYYHADRTNSAYRYARRAVVALSGREGADTYKCRDANPHRTRRVWRTYNNVPTPLPGRKCTLCSEKFTRNIPQKSLLQCTHVVRVVIRYVVRYVSRRFQGVCVRAQGVGEYFRLFHRRDLHSSLSLPPDNTITT